MGYWKEIKNSFLAAIDDSVKLYKETDSFTEATKKEMQLLQLRRDLFLEQRKLQEVLADLGEVAHEAYTEQGNIYRDDMHDIMHHVAEIEAQCKKLQNEIDNLTQ
jgi:adenylosuccinate lyase